MEIANDQVTGRRLKRNASYTPYNQTFCILAVSADGPQTAGLVTQPFQTVAGDVFLASEATV